MRYPSYAQAMDRPGTVFFVDDHQRGGAAVVTTLALYHDLSPLTRHTLTHPDLSHGAHQPRAAHTTAALRTRTPGTSWGPLRGHPVHSAPVHRTQPPPRRCRSPAGTLTCWCRPAMGPASLVLLRPGAMSVGDTRQCQRSHRPLGLVEANPRKIAQNSSGQRRY